MAPPALSPRAILHSLLDLCFPWSCAVCQAGYEGRGPLCPTCAAHLRELEEEPHCPMCAILLPMHASPCPQCMGKGPANFHRMVRLGPYADPLRELIIHLKFHRKWGLGEELALRLFAREPVKAILRETDVLVAVPLHWKRHFLRWYNQSEVIARMLSKQCKKPLARPIKRIKSTEPQTNLHSRAQREENLKDAFRLVDGKSIAGKHVTIVDDVWTTGATLQAVARTLKRAKPASLSAIVVAVTDPRGYERVEKRPEIPSTTPVPPPV